MSLAYGARTSGVHASGGLTRGVSYHDTVREGSLFRVRISFDGGQPSEGGCEVGISDSNGDTSTAFARANDVDATAVIAVRHDNENDDGRTVTVTLRSCSLPDLDRAGISYRIGSPNTVTVAVTTAGPVVDPDDGTYTVTLTDIGWEMPDDRYHYERLTFSLSLDNAPPVTAVVLYTLDDSQEEPSYTHSTNLSGGSTGKDHWKQMPSTTPGTTRTITVTLTSLVKLRGSWPDFHLPPGGTYLIGSPSSDSVTFTVEDDG